MLERLRVLLDLSEDQALPERIDAEIRSVVNFRGTTLWLLAFAIVIASVGLNINSTAVIIGAMLVSPLMGPILGVGYAVAVSDLKLLRRSLLNLVLATVVSLAASTAYFSLSPLSEAQSELLARTHPTIFDVVIALFGGLAGIVGVTRKERSNVLPGVAIATALMPPLCTAGFGISRLDLIFFSGAFYLFFINCVFIAFATWGMVRLMRLPEIAHADKTAARRAHRGMLLVGVCTALPSILFAQQLVADEVFLSHAGRFLTAAFPEDATTVLIERDLDRNAHRIRATVVGEPVSADRVAELQSLLPQYGLDGVVFELRQPGSSGIDLATTRREVAQEAFPQLVSHLEAAQARVAELEGLVKGVEDESATIRAIEAELMAQLPMASGATLTWAGPSDAPTAAIALVVTDAPLAPEDRTRTATWLGVRTHAAKVAVVDERPLTPAPPEATGPLDATAPSAPSDGTGRTTAPP